MKHPKKFILSLLTILFCCCYCQALAAKNITILTYRFSAKPHEARLVFELNKSPHYDVFRLHHPERLVLDIKDARLRKRLKHYLKHNNFAKDLRYAMFKPHELRIVIDLKKVVNYKSFLLKAAKHRKPRLVIDLYSHETNPHKIAKAARHRKSMPAYLKSKKKYLHYRKVVVVIDPGHGGKDPGATGPGGIHEKNVVLAIGKDLRRDIDRQPGMIAKLTRKGDYYLTLRQRLRIARRDKADIFIAIHADAFPNRRAQGASVFALSLRGASNEAARWLAEKENASELLGGVNLDDKSYTLRSVLLDLSQTATISSSIHLGGDVLGELKHSTILHHSKVEQAAFVVLKSPDIPSILIETGFITNPYEERRLNSHRYQHRLAHAITEGVRDYFKQKPIPGTWFAKKK